MRFIPTKFHAPLDYIVGAVLIAGPWIFQYSDSGAATAISIVLGIGLIAYSLFTNYELGLWKVAPMAVHNLIDIVAGVLLAAAPWLFGFADEGANFWVPFVVIGVAAIFLGLTTNGTQKFAPSSAKPNSHGDAASSTPATMSMRLCTAIGATFQRPSS